MREPMQFLNRGGHKVFIGTRVCSYPELEEGRLAMLSSPWLWQSTHIKSDKYVRKTKHERHPALL